MHNKENKKLKEVAALQYAPEAGGAPKIIALGKGETAEKILEAARENDIPVFEDASLAKTLNQMKIGDEIPPELYDVVAEILVFVSKIDQSYADRRNLKRTNRND